MKFITKSDERIQELRSLAERNQYSRRVFELFANRVYNQSRSLIDRIKALAPDVSDIEILDIFTNLDDMGIGRLIMGRGKAKTQFLWHYTVISVGRTALGQTDLLQPMHSVYELDDELFAENKRKVSIPIRDGVDNVVMILPRDLKLSDLENVKEFLVENDLLRPFHMVA